MGKVIKWASMPVDLMQLTLVELKSNGELLDISAYQTESGIDLSERQDADIEARFKLTLDPDVIRGQLLEGETIESSVRFVLVTNCDKSSNRAIYELEKASEGEYTAKICSTPYWLGSVQLIARAVRSHVGPKQGAKPYKYAEILLTSNSFRVDYESQSSVSSNGNVGDGGWISFAEANLPEDALWHVGLDGGWSLKLNQDVNWFKRFVMSNKLDSNQKSLRRFLFEVIGYDFRFRVHSYVTNIAEFDESTPEIKKWSTKSARSQIPPCTPEEWHRDFRIPDITPGEQRSRSTTSMQLEGRYGLKDRLQKLCKKLEEQ